MPKILRAKKWTIHLSQDQLRETILKLRFGTNMPYRPKYACFTIKFIAEYTGYS